MGNFLFVVNTVDKDGQTVAQISRFGANSDNKGVNEYYLNKLDKIDDFCHYFPSRMDAFFKQNKKLMYEKPAEEIKDRITTLQKAKTDFEQDKSLYFYMISTRYPQRRKLIELTPKDRKIIRLSMKGYTADMISKELYVSLSNS